MKNKEKTTEEEENSCPSEQNISFRNLISDLSRAGRDNRLQAVWHQGDEEAHVTEGCTGTEAGLLADLLCRPWIPLPHCHLLYSLTYIIFITSRCDRRGEIASMFGGAFLSPAIRGTPVWVPQWDLSLATSQSSICLYSSIQAPGLTVTSSPSCCSLFLKHLWVFGELFCSFVYVLTKCMSHILIRTLLWAKKFIKCSGQTHGWKDESMDAYVDGEGMNERHR